MTIIGVIGLGAVGASYAARISDAHPEAELRVVADGPRAERVRREGVVVNGERYRFPVVEPGQSVTLADLVIVAVKCHHLPEAIEQLAGQVGPDTIILSLLNGITSEAELRAAYPQASIPLAVAVGIDAVRDEAGVRYTTLGWVEFGDPVPGEPSAGVVRLEGLLAAAGVPFVVKSDMLHALWWKFLVNTGVNQVSALLDAPYGLVQTAGPARDLMIAAQREVVAVAQASGVDLTEATSCDSSTSSTRWGRRTSRRWHRTRSRTGVRRSISSPESWSSSANATACRRPSTPSCCRRSSPSTSCGEWTERGP